MTDSQKPISNTVGDYFLRVVKEMSQHRGVMRFGQMLFNVLHEMRPELANAVRGSELDPFYTQDEEVLSNFLVYVVEEWDE